MICDNLNCLGGLSPIRVMELIPNSRSGLPTSVHIWPGCIWTFLPCLRSVRSTTTCAIKHFGLFVFLLKGYNPTTLSTLTEYRIVFPLPWCGDRTVTSGNVFSIHTGSAISSLALGSLKTVVGVAFVARSATNSSSEDVSEDSTVGSPDFSESAAGAGCCVALIFGALGGCVRWLPRRFLARARSGKTVRPSIDLRLRADLFSPFIFKSRNQWGWSQC